MKRALLVTLRFLAAFSAFADDPKAKRVLIDEVLELIDVRALTEASRPALRVGRAKQLSTPGASIIYGDSQDAGIIFQDEMFLQAPKEAKEPAGQ